MVHHVTPSSPPEPPPELGSARRQPRKRNVASGTGHGAWAKKCKQKTTITSPVNRLAYAPDIYFSFRLCTTAADRLHQPQRGKRHGMDDTTPRRSRGRPEQIIRTQLNSLSHSHRVSALDNEAPVDKHRYIYPPEVPCILNGFLQPLDIYRNTSFILLPPTAPPPPVPSCALLSTSATPLRIPSPDLCLCPRPCSRACWSADPL